MPAEIIVARPPNYDDIVAVFPQVKYMPGVIFSWGSAIYNPDNIVITGWLRAHEGVHGQNQRLTGIYTWWDKYLKDKDFRFGEEVPAHYTEFKQFCAMVKDPRRREAELISIAGRLSGPLYGNMVALPEARRLVRFGRT